jgi:GTP-binding protein
MKKLNSHFLVAATSMEQLPVLSLPEIAFAGRSNVGKSSLLNSLVMQKNLAHTSSNPGKTQSINLYKVDERWIFADLPGFGYAAVSKEKRAIWREMNLNYILSRKKLAFVVALIDSRHEPMEIDLSFIEWLENNNRKFLVVLTKCDKISKTEIQERKAQFDELLQYCKYAIEVLPYSSMTYEGREQFLAIIRKETSIIKNYEL